MHFSVAALAALAAFGSNFGANALAVPNNDLALSSHALAVRDIAANAIDKRVPAGGVPGGPPKTPSPPPGRVSPGRTSPGRTSPGRVMGSPGEDAITANSDSEYFDSTPEQSPVRSTPFNFRTIKPTVDPTKVTEDNPCGIVGGGGGAKVKRMGDVNDVPVVPEDDPLHWRNIYLWLKEQSGLDPKKVVFFSGTSGQAQAEAFTDANTEYRYFWDIFVTPKDGSGKTNVAKMLDTHIKGSGITEGVGKLSQAEASKALGLFGVDPLVFNHEGRKYFTLIQRLTIPPLILL